MQICCDDGNVFEGFPEILVPFFAKGCQKKPSRLTNFAPETRLMKPKKERFMTQSSKT